MDGPCRAPSSARRWSILDRDVPPGPGLVAIASGSDPGAALPAALAGIDASPPPGGAMVLLAPPPTSRALRRVARLLAGGHAVVRPVGLLGAAFFGRSAWRAVALGSGARRFERVLVPDGLLDAPRFLLAPLPRGRGEPTPIAALAGFAHPRQRLAALVGEAGAAAELAAPLRPRLVVLIAADGTVAATRDLVAAELVARAAVPDADGPGPWEHPAVQRAIELDLGLGAVRDLHLVATGAAASELADRLRPRLGLPPMPPGAVASS